MERFDYPVLLKAAEKDVRGRIIFLITNFLAAALAHAKRPPLVASRCPDFAT